MSSLAGGQDAGDAKEQHGIDSSALDDGARVPRSRPTRPIGSVGFLAFVHGIGARGTNNYDKSVWSRPMDDSRSVLASSGDREVLSDDWPL